MLPSVYIDENDIFHEHHHDEYVTVSLAMYVANERKMLAGTRKLPLLISFDKLVGFAPETRDMSLDVILANVSAMGFLVDTTTEEGRVSKQNMERFYRITPYPVPVSIFDDKTQAIEWLKQHRVSE